MNVSRLSTIICLFGLLFFSNCGDDDAGPTGDPGTIIAKIDGVDFIAGGIFVSGVLSDDPNGTFTLAIGGVNGNSIYSEALVIGIFGTDFEDVKAGDVFTATNASSFMVGTYTADTSTGEISATSSLDARNTCTITKIDHVAKIVSVQFTFYAIDDDDQNKTYEIIDGLITDVAFD